MALDGGAVTVASDLSHAGSGLALALYEGLKTIATDDADNWEAMALADGQRASVLGNFANLANKLGPAIVQYFIDNAETTTNITTLDSGLQLLPATLAEDEPTKAPTATKTLSGTLA